MCTEPAIVQYCGHQENLPPLHKCSGFDCGNVILLNYEAAGKCVFKWIKKMNKQHMKIALSLFKSILLSRISSDLSFMNTQEPLLLNTLSEEQTPILLPTTDKHVLLALTISTLFGNFILLYFLEYSAILPVGMSAHHSTYHTPSAPLSSLKYPKKLQQKCLNK